MKGPCFNMGILKQVIILGVWEGLLFVIVALPGLFSYLFCGNEEKLLERCDFSSFPQYCQYISNVRSQSIYSFVKCGCSIYFFLLSVNPICRGMDISKYFRESLWFRDNGSRLYIGIKRDGWALVKSGLNPKQSYCLPFSFAVPLPLFVMLLLFKVLSFDVRSCHSTLTGCLRKTVSKGCDLSWKLFLKILNGFNTIYVLICYSSLFVRRWLYMWRLFCQTCFFSLLLLVPREGCASCLRHFLGIFTYISMSFFQTYS